MSENTKISWAHHTWSPWYGCTKISPGCANCYAEQWAKRSGLVEWGDDHYRRMNGNWHRPVTWNKKASATHKPRVFPSLCDVGDPKAELELLNNFMVLIDKTPNLRWLLLTKRPAIFWERWIKIARHWGRTDYQLPDNIWFGVTCENQQTADERLPILATIPAKVRWVSFEPLLEKVYLKSDVRFDWAVIGGESGPKYREVDVEAIHQLASAIWFTSTPVFVKQDCGRFPGKQGRIHDAIWELKQFPNAA